MPAKSVTQCGGGDSKVKMRIARVAERASAGFPRLGQRTLLVRAMRAGAIGGPNDGVATQRAHWRWPAYRRSFHRWSKCGCVSRVKGPLQRVNRKGDPGPCGVITSERRTDPVAETRGLPRDQKEARLRPCTASAPGEGARRR
ncbi:hypothetical protein MTO96_011305 [Rhipicephalus appendiculatus]